VLHSQDTSI